MYPGHNCTNYAAYRLFKNGIDASYLRGQGNAYQWGGVARSRGVAVDGTPRVGDIAWWDKNSGGAGVDGHVSYVEQVGPGYIITSEDNWGGDFHWVKRTPGSNYPTAFIHFGGGGQGMVEGSFVSVRENGQVYRIVGGAPIYVSNWNVFGGPQPVVGISLAQLNSLRQYPADGTFVATSPRGEVYRIAGGAPIYVSSWSVFGGSQPLTTIDAAAVDHAGAGSVWNHLRQQPADGTFVATSPRGEVYRIAGGAPIYVSSWSVFGGSQPLTTIDAAAVDHAGAGSVWNHLRQQPADGTFVATSPRGEVYRIAGGAPIYVSSWSVFGGSQPLTTIDAAAVDHAGAGSVWNHLRQQPADGTFIVGAQSNAAYKVTRGGARLIANWDLYGGPRPSTLVDQVAITNAGAGSVWNHLLYAPPVTGDLDSDGFAGCADLAILKSHFGETPAGPGHGDLNGDGVVNILDFSILSSHWTPAPGDAC